ncbi:MAG: TonB-dependent receptor plug domain-containing protein [Verrucomicrobiota bacterium]|nr:TonB-dependent receptor plug domain-containing protein [Verrucomicrobiota bacterium]
MREVDGTQITVTKKATVIKLDQQPEVVNQNQQELYNKAPGLFVGEQNTPSQYNLSYRGLGNPQESEYVNVLQDGMSIMSDWIGFPTLYYSPLPQTISEVQVIRGGGSSLYGPEPAPAVNFVSRRPGQDEPFTFATEHIGGGYGLYSTYNFVEGTAGPLGYLAILVTYTATGSARTLITTSTRATFTSPINRDRVKTHGSTSAPIMSRQAIRDASRSSNTIRMPGRRSLPTTATGSIATTLL